MNRPVRCPAGNVYDAEVHAECPCPSCWAERSSRKLVGARGTDAEEQLSAASETNMATAEWTVSPQHIQQPSFRQKLKKILKFRGDRQEITATPVSAAFSLGMAAVFSALLSIHFPMDPWHILQFGFHSQQKAPLLPGLYFALVICIGIHLWEKSARIILFGTFATILVAWIAAWETAIAVIDRLSKTSNGEINIISVQVVAGCAAGFAGSLITTCFVCKLRSRSEDKGMCGKPLVLAFHRIDPSNVSRARSQHSRLRGFPEGCADGPGLVLRDRPTAIAPTTALDPSWGVCSKVLASGLAHATRLHVKFAWNKDSTLGRVASVVAD
jgi:hypothetical protein